MIIQNNFSRKDNAADVALPIINEGQKMQQFTQPVSRRDENRSNFEIQFRNGGGETNAT